VLLDAAIKIKHDSPHEESGVVGEFLRRFTDLIMGIGPEKGREFLQLTLEGLLQIDSAREAQATHLHQKIHDKSVQLGNGNLNWR
jgi:hypothetical protein